MGAERKRKGSYHKVRFSLLPFIVNTSIDSNKSQVKRRARASCRCTFDEDFKTLSRQSTNMARSATTIFLIMFSSISKIISEMFSFYLYYFITENIFYSQLVIILNCVLIVSGTENLNYMLNYNTYCFSYNMCLSYFFNNNC